MFYYQNLFLYISKDANISFLSLNTTCLQMKNLSKEEFGPVEKNSWIPAM